MRYSRLACVALLLLSCILHSTVFAAGTRNFEFLRVGITPRPAAMGGAFVALSDGVGGLPWNPAGLSRIEDSQALAAYMHLPQDVQAGLVALGRSVPGGWALGVGLKYLSFGSMKQTAATDPVGQHTDSFSASDVAVTLGTAYRVTPGLQLGVGATYVSGSIESYRADAVAVSVGLLLDLAVENISLGASLRNLQITGSSYLEEQISLPTEGRIGISLRSASGTALVGIDLAVGGEDGVHVASGGELLLGNSLWLRAGMDGERWDMGRQATGWGTLSAFSWGLGMVREEWCVDYGINPFGQLGTVHRVSIKSEI